MADYQRFRHADAKRVRDFEVDSATVIEVGDLVWQDTDDVKPASDFSYGSDLAETQADFRRDFCGVAMDASDSGDTANIAVAQAGTFIFDCSSATFEIGDLLGPDDNTGGTALLDQTVIAVGENEYGGVLAATKRYSSNTTAVECEILPNVAAQEPKSEIITFGTFDITSTADVVTDWPVEEPFKLVAIRTINAVALTSDTTLTVDNGTTSLDDTHATGTGAAGAVVRTVMDDSSGDDIFTAGDTLTIKSNGAGSASEEVTLQAEIIKYRHES